MRNKRVEDINVYIYECKILWSLYVCIYKIMFFHSCSVLQHLEEENVKITSECEALFLRRCGPFSALPQFLMVR